MPGPYFIMSWNVDKYADPKNFNIHLWLKRLLQAYRPALVFLSETKLSAPALEQYFQEFTEYRAVINVHTPAQYHGVAMLIRNDLSFQQYQVSLNIPVRHDNKTQDPASGRLIVGLLDNQYYVVGAYVPNSGIGKGWEEKMQYRIQHWDPAMYTLLTTLQQTHPTIWVGDLNVAPTMLDVSSAEFVGCPGVRPEEQANFRKYLDDGWIDTWRMFHPEAREFSWRGYNVPSKPGIPSSMVYGMRLDHILVSHTLKDRVTNAFMIHDCPPKTDHIPVCVYLN